MTEALLQFVFLKNSKGIQHWFVQRISALSFFVLFLIVYFTNNLILGSFSIFFLVWHISYGLETLIVDYMHDSLAYIYTEAVLDILIVCLVKAIFLFYVYI